MQMVFIIAVFGVLARSSGKSDTNDTMNRNKEVLRMWGSGGLERFYWDGIQTVSNESKMVGFEDISAWRSLIWTVNGVLQAQSGPSGHVTQLDLNIILFQDSLWQAIGDIASKLNGLHAWTKLVYVNVDRGDVAGTLQLLSPHSTTARNVIVVSDRIPFIVDLLCELMTTQEFRWTALIHITEWLLISECELESALLDREIPDFVTYVCSTDLYLVSVSQRERNSGLERIARFDFSAAHSNVATELKLLDSTREQMTKNVFTSESQTIRNCNQQKHGGMQELSLDEDAQDPIPILSTSLIKMAAAVQEKISRLRRFRQHAVLYLRTKKSLLDGVRAKVSMFLSTSDPVELLSERTEHNQTTYDGFLVQLLHLLAQRLGFHYEISLVQDGGYYGKEMPDGTKTGMLGQLYRRETAFTMIPLSLNERRRLVIDYIECQIGLDQAKFIYKLQEEDVLDTTFADIVQKDLVFLLLAPLCVIALLGGVVHVVTRSCTSATPQPCSLHALRELQSYPEHFCFETNIYPSQSGRILKASWGVTWLILSSMYSAYLTSTFAVGSGEIRIRSLADLTNAVSYRIGVNGRMSSFITSMEKAANGTVERKLYNKLQDLNRTSPLTFSDNVTYHMSQVLQGKYIFVTYSPFKGILVDATVPDDTLIRSEPVESPHSYVGVPFNVFYKEDLNLALLNIVESGVTSKLQGTFPQLGQGVKNSKANGQAAVPFSRIKFLVYVVTACISISCLVLGLEICYVRMKIWIDTIRLQGSDLF